MAFPTTRWTLIRQAVATPSGESRAALEELCQRYSPPVLALLCTSVVMPAELAVVVGSTVRIGLSVLLPGAAIEGADAADALAVAIADAHLAR